MNEFRIPRRAFLSGVAAAASSRRLMAFHQPSRPDPQKQPVAGPADAAAAGNAVLSAGGNAVDAIVTAALVAGVVSVQQTGIGGYGGHIMIAGLPDGKVTAIDFNSMAPAALTADYFHANENGEVKGGANAHGWLSAGVPGVLAGLQSALDKYGTKRFPEVVSPAIRVARDGFIVSKGLASAVKGARHRLADDPGSAKLLLPGGEPIQEGATLRNPDLARLLETLADAGSVAPFYRGKIAESLADAFRTNGGLVTAADLAAYQAIEVTPLALEWNGQTIHTPPPTSGGLTVLQTLSTIKALGNKETAGPSFVEALRIAWMDRLTLLGDPAFVDVPVQRLLSEDYASQSAERVRRALRDRKPVEGTSDGRSAGGTVHLNAVDANGLTVSLTFTHGDSLGAQVTVDGLGLVLGHGMSRFDPRPGRPNSPEPLKRPLHNMCPTIVSQGGNPLLALGATGGRRIVNSVTNALAYRIGDGLALDAAVKAPRVHCEGGMTLTTEADYPGVNVLKAVGYTVTTGSVGSLVATERHIRTSIVKTSSR